MRASTTSNTSSTRVVQYSYDKAKYEESTGEKDGWGFVDIKKCGGCFSRNVEGPKELRGKNYLAGKKRQLFY